MTVASPLWFRARALVTFVTVALTTAVAPPIANTASTSYLLSYDGIISERILRDKSSSLIAEAITKLIASSINNDDAFDINKDAQLEITCLPRKNSSTKCVADHMRPGFSFDITTSVYAIDDVDAPFGLRIDATIVSASGENARDQLVQVVPIIDDNISSDAEETVATWNVRERSMPVALQSKKYLSAPASIDERIFATDKIEEKRLIFSNSDIDKASSKIDIWEYKSTETGESYRDMFLDSTLRATTSDTGIAHAEAFVHPAMISQPLPKRVAVISDMPVAFVKEILKYKSVTDITLIGTNQEAIGAVTSHMPQINDCTMLQNVSRNCMDDERLEIIEGNVMTWFESIIHQCKDIETWVNCEYNKDEYEGCAPHPAYDVVLVDVSTADQIKQWLSIDFYTKHYKFTILDSVLVFNTGSPPTAEGGGNTAEIKKFIDSVQENEYQDEYSVLIFVYDEVRSFLLR